jgi:hypothetical protein
VDEVVLINTTIAHFMCKTPHPSGMRLPPSPRGRLTNLPAKQKFTAGKVNAVALFL